MELHEVLQDGTVRVSAETYTVCQAGESHSDVFATIQDDTETTVVIEESAVRRFDATQVEPDWKRLTFEMDLPLKLVGVLGTVATELASVDVSVFVLSSYSTDHVFATETDLNDAVAQLEELGCRVRTHDDT